MARRIDQVLADWVTVLDAVTSTPYQQGGLAVPFHEAGTLDLADEASGLSHLAYVLRTPLIEERGVATSGSSGAVSGLVTARVDLELGYFVRHDNQASDYRLFIRAMGDLVQAITGAPASWDSDAASVVCRVRFEETVEQQNGVARARASFDLTTNELDS